MEEARYIIETKEENGEQNKTCEIIIWLDYLEFLFLLMTFSKNKFPIQQLK
jgi:hypothetical protein